MGLQDGRRIVVQILPEPEVIGSDDLVVSVRVASYENKLLSRVFDVPLSRSTTVNQLYAHLLNKLPHLNEEPPTASDSNVQGGEDLTSGGDGAQAENAAGASEDAGSSLPADNSANTPPNLQSKYLALAKGFSTGPPLTLKSALKLKWNDPSVLCRGDAPIDHPPLNLRDGSLIVVRGVADFERAKAALKAKREAEGPRPASAGTGAAAARARRPGSRYLNL
jgi:hypothetical protein